MRQVETRYAISRELRIAYQVVGQGSLDLILVPGFISNLDVLWELPGYDHLIRRLAAFSRVILFDKPGTGLSDRLDPSSQPDLDQRTDDIVAVLDAVGSNGTAILGCSDGAALAIHFAVRNPKRSRALVLYGAYAKFLGPVMDSGKFNHLVEGIDASWGTGATAAQLVPSLASDARFVAWWARFERLSASPTAAKHLARMTGTLDVVAELDRIDCPVLVIHRAADQFVRAAAVRDLAKRIAGSRLVELPGRDHPIWSGDTDKLANEVAEFLTGERPSTHGNLALAALLVARVMAANGTAPVRGDSRHLGERIEHLQDEVPGLLSRYGGKVDWTSSNDMVARFDGVTKAVSCSVALRDTAAHLGLAIGQGIHVGEIDAEQSSLTGPTLDVAVRIAASARSAEILLSRLASEMVSRTGLQFLEHRAIGVEGVDEPIVVVAIATERHLEPMGHHVSFADLGTLSLRERQVLALVAEGMINSVIAVQLGLSQHTVKRHVSNILLKLDLPTRAAAAALVSRHATE